MKNQWNPFLSEACLVSDDDDVDPLISSTLTYISDGDDTMDQFDQLEIPTGHIMDGIDENFNRYELELASTVSYDVSISDDDLSLISSTCSSPGRGSSTEDPVCDLSALTELPINAENNSYDGTRSPNISLEYLNINETLLPPDQQKELTCLVNQRNPRSSPTISKTFLERLEELDTNRDVFMDSVIPSASSVRVEHGPLLEIPVEGGALALLYCAEVMPQFL